MSANGCQRELFVVFDVPQRFRLRVNDLIRIEGRIGHVIRVTESAAVVLVNQPRREFKTRFDKPVQFRQPPKTVRISANSESEILYRPSARPIRSKRRRAA